MFAGAVLQAFAGPPYNRRHARSACARHEKRVMRDRARTALRGAEDPTR
ncbi:hypothetical protein BDI4_590031 [Burkholderia diffusa]|nr:hypothetical protein BDI4_590031 [Burkholderia diffusa]